MMQDTTKCAANAAQTVGAVLDALAKRFGATGAHLWAVLVRQVYVDAVRSMLLAIFTLTVALYLLRSAKRQYAVYAGVKRSDWSEPPAPCIITGVLAIVMIVGGVIAAVDAIRSVAQVFNPEYGAMIIVLRAVGK